jgi:signal transduction protein with GAF and PtsI domain
MKFYSEKLDKMFDTEKQLLEAEEAAFKAEQEAKAKSLEKKAEAKVVEDAFKAHNQAKLEFNQKVALLKKAYHENLINLKKQFNADLQTEEKKLTEAAESYDTALSTFIEKHPEGYHMTLKDGDNVVTISSSVGEGTEQLFEDIFNPNKFWEDFIRIFKR